MRSVRKSGGVIAGAACVFLFTACAAPIGGTSRDVVSAAGSKSKTKALNAMTFYAYGHLLERQGNFSRAASQYRLALSRQPSFPSAKNRLGITLNKLGKHAEACEMFLDAIESSPGQAHLHNNLGFSLLLEGKYTQAEAAIGRALKLKPEFRRAHMNRAIVLAKLGRYDEAFAEFAAVGGAADAHFNLAMLQIDARMYDRSRDSLRRALALQPNLKAAQVQLDRLAARPSKAEAALVAEALAPSSEPVASDPETATETSRPQSSDPEPVQTAVAFELSSQTGGDGAIDLSVIEQPASDVGQTDMGAALERAFADEFDDLNSDADAVAVSHSAVERVDPQPSSVLAEIVIVDAEAADPPVAATFDYPYPSTPDPGLATAVSSASLSATSRTEFDPSLPGLTSVTLAALDWLENLDLEMPTVNFGAIVSTTFGAQTQQIETNTVPAATGSVLTSENVQRSIGDLLVEAEYLAELLFLVQGELGVEEAFALTGEIDALISEHMADIAALDDLRCTLLDEEMSVAVVEHD